jgi:RHS repeat-associated protein
LEKAYDFYPYGLPVKETVGQERLWFASYELEHQDTSEYTDDLYFLHARWYFAYMGRFLSPDPLRGDPAQPQSLNLYAYVRGNPINFVDPFGLKDQGAMSPASTSDESQRDGVCTDVMSDPDCWKEQITVTAKAPRIDLQQIADAHDAKVLQEWLEWQAYTNSAYALRTARRAGPGAPGREPASWQSGLGQPWDWIAQNTDVSVGVDFWALNLSAAADSRRVSKASNFSLFAVGFDASLTFGSDRRRAAAKHLVGVTYGIPPIIPPASPYGLTFTLYLDDGSLVGLSINFGLGAFIQPKLTDYCKWR